MWAGNQEPRMNSETQTCDLRADFKRDEEQEE